MRFLSRVLPVLLLTGLLAGAPIRVHAVIRMDIGVTAARRTISFPVNGLQYGPADLTILKGDEVEWSGSFAFHPLVSDDGLWPTVSTGDSFRFTFTQPGAYRYHCQVHGAAGGVGMAGIVRVVAPTRIYLPAVFGNPALPTP